MHGRGNIIGFAFNAKTSPYALKDLRKRAMALEATYHIEFPRFLKEIVKHNASVLQNVIISHAR